MNQPIDFRFVANGFVTLFWRDALLNEAADRRLAVDPSLLAVDPSLVDRRRPPIGGGPSDQLQVIVLWLVDGGPFWSVPGVQTP